MIIDATKINYFKYPERSVFDQPQPKKRIKDKDDLGVIIDASLTNKKRKKKALSRRRFEVFNDSNES